MTFKTGIYDPKVYTFSGHLCSFNDYYDHDNKYKVPVTGTCTRKYQEKVEATMENAAYKPFWWEERTAPYPWCYHEGGSWSYCKGFVYFEIYYHWKNLKSNKNLLIFKIKIFNLLT